MAVLQGFTTGYLHALEAQALQGLLEQRVFAGKGEELLGIQLARPGPEARAAAARKNHRDHVVCLHSISV